RRRGAWRPRRAWRAPRARTTSSELPLHVLEDALEHRASIARVIRAALGVARPVRVLVAVEDALRVRHHAEHGAHLVRDARDAAQRSARAPRVRGLAAFGVRVGEDDLVVVPELLED